MIAMNDLAATPAAEREAMLEACARVLDSGWYVLGRELTRFEQAWAATCGVAHGVGVGNGMDAIEIALRALNIGPGDEVITTAMTAFATVLAIQRAGATPVLADIDPATALLDPESVRRCLTPRTKALVLVHLYGQMRGMGGWLALCRDAGIELIEDCAQAHLAQSQGRVAGSWGRAGAYSFYPTKNLGAIGDAGMLVSHDTALAQAAAQLRNYGQSVRYHHPVLGVNSRLDELQAALLMERLPALAAATERRRAIAAALRQAISNPAVRLLAAPEEAMAHVHHLFVVTCDKRDALQAHLQAQGVQSLIHYPVPVHHQPPCAGVAIDPRGMAATEAHAATCLSIPCAPHLSEADVDQMIEAINSFARDED
jgi:dTDP-4-amino-4,6-dideoxygalactose transaminase